tara:strand:+ start:8535 stop:12548 length:4014 start_codon:yes stop_codon:yes gene_type:complete
MNRVIILLIILTFSWEMFSQEDEKKDIAITSFKLSSGLNSDNVRHIIQDSLGYIWVGTSNELYKFDGQSTYSISLFEEKDSLFYIEHLFKDNYGNIWIITSDGIRIFEFTTQKIIAPPVEFDQYSISSFYQGEGEDLWFSTREGEMLNYTAGNKGLIAYPSSQNSPITTIVPFTKNELILSFENSQFETFNTDNRTFSSDVDLEKLNLGNEPVYNGVKCENDEIILASRKRLFQLGQNKKLTELETISNTKDNKQALFISDLLKVNDSIIWIATDGHGLMRYNRKSKKIQGLDLESEFPIYAISSLFMDRNEIIWIGTTNSGLKVFDPHQSKFSHWGYEKGNLTGLSSNSVLCLSETLDGRVLVGLDGGGINIYDTETNLFEHYLHPQKDKNVINSIIADHKNNIWVGTYLNGLNLFREKNSIFSFIDHPTADTKHNEVIKSLHIDSKKNLWIGTSNGVFVHDSDGMLIRHINKTDEEDRQDLGLVMCIQEMADSTIWIGTNNLLARYLPSLGIIEKVNFDDSNPIVTSILEVDDVVWVGTKSGLFQYETKDGTTKKYTADDGLSCTVINGLLNDDMGNLWVATTQGLFQYDIKRNKFRNFGFDDGFEGQFNENATLKGSDGKLYFGSTNGVYSFFPTQIKKNHKIPPVVISKISIYNQNKSHLDSINYVNSRNLINQNEIELAYDQNIFSIDFVGINFTLANKNEYRHILHGYDKFWNKTDRQRKATYTNVPPGEYAFQVKAANNDGVWNNEGKTLKIRIDPPWYNTVWAISLWIIMALLFLFYVNRYIWRQIKLKETLRTERMDKLRQEEANENKIQFFTNITHELRTPLTLILGPIDKLITNTKVDLSQRKQLHLIKKNTNRLLILINQILDFRKLELGEININISRINLVLFIGEICDSFKEMANEKSISIQYTPHIDNLEVLSDSGTIEKIMFNLLANAIKFSSENDEIEVDLSMDQHTNEAVIDVIDMGKGIPENELSNIFKRFYQVKSNTNTGTGIGLALTHDMVKLIKGTINVKSKLGSGSTFSVRLPLGSSHFNMEIPEIHSSNDDMENGNVPLVLKPTEEPYLQGDQFELESNKYSVLVIEDEKDLREYIVESLKEFFEVWEASNGEDGYKMAIDLNPNLIISDILMPKLSGLELCQHLKSNFSTSHIPIILLTALTSNNQKIEGMGKGADDYITKPFNSVLLIHKVHNLIKNRIKLIARFKTEIAMEPEAITSTSADEQFLKQVIEIIKDNISDSNFKVEHITNKIAMSRSPFYKRLKNLSGLSPNEFIRMVRMKHAVQLLTKSDKNISEIAYEVGFSSPKYFRLCFKEQFGVTPSEFGKAPQGNL